MKVYQYHQLRIFACLGDWAADGSCALSARGKYAMWLPLRDLHSSVDTSDSAPLYGLLPLVSVEWALINQARELLLVQRNAAPARGTCFKLGRRAQRKRRVFRALLRVAKEELVCSAPIAAALI